MTIIENFLDLKNLIVSIHNSTENSVLSVRQIFDLYDLELFRKEQKDFSEKIDQLDDEALQLLREEVFSIIKNKNPKSPFGFYYGDFGNSKSRMDLSLLLLKKSIKEKENPKVCELGTCHGGHTSLWFLHNGIINPKNYFGCDIIPDYCKFLKVFGMNIIPINLVKENFVELFDHDHDVIIVTEIIEHMPNEEQGMLLLKNAMQLLKQGGDMIISYPRIVADISSDDPIGHHYQPNLNSINQTLSQNFLNIEMHFDGKREYHHLSGYKK